MLAAFGLLATWAAAILPADVILGKHQARVPLHFPDRENGIPGGWKNINSLERA